MDIYKIQIPFFTPLLVCVQKRSSISQTVHNPKHVYFRKRGKFNIDDFPRHARSHATYTIYCMLLIHTMQVLIIIRSVAFQYYCTSLALRRVMCGQIIRFASRIAHVSFSLEHGRNQPSLLDTYTSPARTFVTVTQCLPLELNHHISYVT